MIEWQKCSTKSNSCLAQKMKIFFRIPNGMTVVALPRLAGRNLVSRLKFGLWRNAVAQRWLYTRTNNGMEGFRNAFANFSIGAARPTVWKFIEAIRKQQSLANIDMASAAIGNVRAGARRQRIRNGRIGTLLGRYAEDGGNLKLIRGLAYNYLDYI